MALTALAVLALALALDLLVGEPPTRLHPVAWFGRLVAAVDREWSRRERRQRLVGAAVAALAPLVPAAIAGIVVLAGTAVDPRLGAAAAAVVLFLSISLRALLDLVDRVVATSTHDVETAREAVRGLVGRDASALSPADVRSAAIESGGENLADGFAASLLAFALFAPFSLALAASAAAWVKGVNTLDSMLGYPGRPIGTASARLDDLVMWLPARIAAGAIVFASLDPRAVRCVRASARAPASPNSGWPMAALACATAVRLEKPDAYVLNPAADPPTPADAERALSILRRAAAVVVGVAAALAVFASLIASATDPLSATNATGVGVGLP